MKPGSMAAQGSSAAGGTIAHGRASPDFAPAAEAFAKVLASGAELGAACCVYYQGEPMLDMWGGVARLPDQAPWTADTLIPVFSISKGVSALCVLTLVDQGVIDLDEPLARYWPEFAVHSKDVITVREALAHRAGVPALDGEVSFADLRDTVACSARLAAQEPVFTPGSSHLYHALTIGWITSELVRRVTGLSLGRFFRDRIAARLDLDIWFGLPAEQAVRVGSVEPPELSGFIRELCPPGSLPWRAITLNGLLPLELAGPGTGFNDPRVQSVEMAGGNGIATARSLARLYAATMAPLNGDRLLSSATIADACRPVSTGPMWGTEVEGPNWGAGIMLPSPMQPMLGDGSFGHDGAGGSLAFAHPASGISFAYVRNRMAAGGIIDPQVYAVIDALGSCIAQAGGKS